MRVELKTDRNFGIIRDLMIANLINIINSVNVFFFLKWAHDFDNSLFLYLYKMLNKVYIDVKRLGLL